MDPRACLAEIPSIDGLLESPGIAPLQRRYSRRFLAETLREICDDLREGIRNGGGPPPPYAGEIEHQLRRRLDRGPALLPVVNATGILLHTNLGRASLPAEAIEAICAALRQPVALELDLATGERGDRDRIVEDDLLALTGAEAATVVNNNAAAVLLVLNTLAEGREVVVSRGELIEIGGSFRMPEILAKSGARLREVGTTNRTHPADYARAIGASTAALLKVHTSNYRIVGFTSEVPLPELVELGRRHGLPVVEDLGSGALLDLSTFGFPKEPLVRERIALGADVVTFSGDKLLGGPQAGLLVGRRSWIEAIKRNPLRRALRPGKETLAGLAAVLRICREATDPAAVLPAFRQLARPLEELDRVGESALPLLRERLGDEVRLEILSTTAEVGSGALPTVPVASRAIAVEHSRLSADRLAALFRSSSPPILGRIEEGRFLLDLRVVEDPADLVPSAPP